MERVLTLRQIEAELGLNYWTLRRWCRLKRVAYSRTCTGLICMTVSQIDAMLAKMAENGNRHAVTGAPTANQ
jgi:hypothetical protein